MTGARGPALVTSAEYRAMVAKEMSEDALLDHIRKLAKELHLLTYHTYDSRKSEPGWPDLVVAGAERGVLLFRELKKQNGRVSPDQAEWLHALRHLGVDADVWRPSDWLSGRIENEMTATAPTREARDG